MVLSAISVLLSFRMLNSHFIVFVQVCGVKENESHIEEVKSGGYLRLFLDSEPSLLHFFAPMYVVYDDDGFSGYERHHCLPIPHCCFIGMISIYVSEVQVTKRLQGRREGSVDIAAHRFDIIDV